MSVPIFRLFVTALRQNLPRHPIKPAFQVRSLSVMNVATVDVKDSDKLSDESPDIVRNKDMTRYKRRKRQWEEPDPNKIKEDTPEKKRQCDQPFERIKKKKVVLLLGYCGANYYGMQRNPGVLTIEEDLLKALKEAKYITEDDFVNIQQTQFQRSSRTDKGVSAARQVVSIKLPLEIDIGEINKHLPDCIKVFAVKRVTNKFNSKSKCNARTYSYTLPTYVFEPSLVTDEERQQYRISEEKLNEVKKYLSKYKGSKSYHNFTEKKHFHDPSSLRYMMSFDVDKVFVESGMEFAVLLVKGQSFMLHQIRKMVGLTIALVRGHADSSIIDKVFGKEKVMIPTAPGLGLVLDTVHYERYAAKFKDSHDSLTFAEEEEEIKKFTHEHIYPVIVKGEIEDKNMATWLEKLSMHSYEPSEDAVDPTGEKEEVAGDDDDDAIDDDDNDGSDAKKNKSHSKNGKAVEVASDSEKVDDNKNIEVAKDNSVEKGDSDKLVSKSEQ